MRIIACDAVILIFLSVRIFWITFSPHSKRGVTQYKVAQNPSLNFVIYADKSTSGGIVYPAQHLYHLMKFCFHPIIYPPKSPENTPFWVKIVRKIKSLANFEQHFSDIYTFSKTANTPVRQNSAYTCISLYRGKVSSHQTYHNSVVLGYIWLYTGCHTIVYTI